jgi:cytochrome c
MQSIHTTLFAAALTCLSALVSGAQAQSITNGQKVYEAQCTACHNIHENRVGPRHFGVFNRPAATQPDYEYSEALLASRLVWTPANLNRWLTNPQDFVPGQNMGFSLTSSQDRADVIAYLATLK